VFMVIGKGMFTKDNLVTKLHEWGIVNPDIAIRQAEQKGKIICGNDIRILLVGGSI
jgi:hypothetical protein